MSTYGNFQELLAETKLEGDRACALILAANIDNRLRDLLMAFFVEMSNNQKDALFKGNGALSTFSSVTRVAFASGLLSNDEFNDINIIRDIRNLFAHQEQGWSFSTEKVAQLCKSLKMPTTLRAEHPELAPNVQKPRASFEVTAASLVLLLMSRAGEASRSKRTVHVPTSILPRRLSE
jgi:DNA-binding MltR family transcriptional regulator